jgi:enterochelin esterase-like enzyme/drug/metabolite transporter (DMT)-like permease
MRPASAISALLSRRSHERGRRRPGVRRVLLASFALGWVAAGLVGIYSYLENYSLHRGFATPARLARASAGQLLTVHLYSHALGRSSEYLVYLPAAYDSARRYPAFYLLHGSPGRPQEFATISSIGVRLENLISRGRVPPMILVFPDGQINGSMLSDSEWANTRSGQFESYVVEVVNNVDRRFATLADRQERVIAGLSAGGYGAINIALHHLNVFGSVQVWSGYFSQDRSGVFAAATNAELAYNSPIDYVRTLRAALATYRLRAFLYAGRGDSASRQILPMARALTGQGAEVRYAIYPGGHDWQLWNAHLDQMLTLAGRDVRRPPRRAVRLARAATPRTPARAQRAPPPRRVLAPRGHTARSAPNVRHGASARTLGAGGLIGGLLLALASAAVINLGFLLQHRGLRDSRSRDGRQRGLLQAALRSRIWLGGQALGWAGFAAQVRAVSIAPLSLVQSFAAGGLALSVPLAAGLFGHRISRAQLLAVLLTAAGLAVLALGLSSTDARLHTEPLVASVSIGLALAVAIGLARAAAPLAIAAGLFYGVADAGIKAVSLGWTAHGSSALISGWSVLVLTGTLGGFLAFQAALRAGSAITAISLMSGLAALVALSCGLLGFGESLGRSPGIVFAHLLGVTLVLACVPMLATAQTEIADMSEGDDRDVAHPGTPERVALAGGYRTGEHGSSGEQQPLQPRTGTWGTAPQYVAQPQVVRQRE